MKERKYNYPFQPKEKLKALNLLKISTLKFVARRYHTSVNTIFRWKKAYDGTIESLYNKSHRPLSPHPNTQTEEEKKHIDDVVKRNPTSGLNEIYGKLVFSYSYKRNPTTLYKYLVKKDFYKKENKVYKKYVPKTYDTPAKIGVKWQLDVKYVPEQCKCSNIIFDRKFYQYTVIDECSRKRYIYAYLEQCADSTIDFVKRAIRYFGYQPDLIQTDNGVEFTYTKYVKRKHPFDIFLDGLSIEHSLIKPRTPRHNGKVERSHRNDNERFYKYLKFYDLEDLQRQMKSYLYRSNNIPTSALGWKTPNQVQREHLLLDFGVVV